MVSTVVAPLLERSTELAEIDDRLASLHDGSSTGLLIEGPPGIGKTRLLAEAQDRAAEAGVRVLCARAGAIELEFPWGVARQLFEPVLVQAPSSERERLLADAAALALPALGHHPSPVGVGVGGNEFPTLHGLYWLTVNLAGSGPVMLAIDDLHWCDLPSLRFIAYLVARLEGSGILVLGSTRTGEAASPAARDVIGHLALDPAVRVLTPSPLTVSATVTIVHHRLGDSSERGFCEVCQELTGGNPFLLSELLTALADEQVMPTTAAIEHVRRMTPEVVSRSVLLRLSTLPGPSLSIARAVAVLGASATPGRVAALTATEPGVAVDCLQRLVEANILRDEDTPLAFVHPIVHAAVYEDLSALARGRWHERAAEILAEQFAAPAELTGHLLATAPAAKRRTVARLREAAIDALARKRAGVPRPILRLGSHARLRAGSARAGAYRSPGLVAGGAAERRSLGLGHPTTSRADAR